MKRSTKVALTLLVPAMTAFGCGSQTKTAQFPATAQRQGAAASTKTMTVACKNGHSFPVDYTKAGQTVRCPQCDQAVSVTAKSSLTSTHNSYRPGWTFLSWFSGYGSRTGSYSSPTSTPPSTFSNGSHVSTPNNVSSNSHVSRGGFGRTGSFFSGGS